MAAPAPVAAAVPPDPSSEARDMAIVCTDWLDVPIGVTDVPEGVPAPWVVGAGGLLEPGSPSTGSVVPTGPSEADDSPGAAERVEPPGAGTGLAGGTAGTGSACVGGAGSEAGAVSVAGCGGG
ncbi:MAG: hypothetical protein JWN20_635, partial [Jatrophihabitantaceae bacterium]|nr:hypothetical protein [Jatrophihabitantaceae bacterium]